MLKFMWNGIKGTDGKLQKVYYSDSQLINFPSGTLTIYGKHYRSFSPEVCAAFVVENNTDLLTDHFEDDKIRVAPTHPLYGQVLAAMQAQKAHREKLAAKRFGN